MQLNLNNPIAERPTMTVYRDGDKAIKLFVENYLESNILNEAFINCKKFHGNPPIKMKIVQISV